MDTRSNQKGEPARRSGRWIAAAAIAGALALGLGGLLVQGGIADASAIEFTDVRKQTLEFHEYERSITLTAEQEAVMREALTALPAPCCGDRTAYTCCCQCNMAKSWWGLSKHLIANLGYDAEQVREVVQEWFEFINPDGFGGKACYTGGCMRPFHRDGCGGMQEDQIVF